MGSYVFGQRGYTLMPAGLPDGGILPV